MREYRSVLACIDDFDRDAKMLHTLKTSFAWPVPEEVHLIYVSEDLWRPIYSAGPTLAETRHESGIPTIPVFPLDEQKERLHHLAQNPLGHLSDCTFRTHVMYGSPLYEILDYGMTRTVDVIVIRQMFDEASEKGSKALLARRITRRSTCSVLTVPGHLHI